MVFNPSKSKLEVTCVLQRPTHLSWRGLVYIVMSLTSARPGHKFSANSLDNLTTTSLHVGRIDEKYKTMSRNGNQNNEKKQRVSTVLGIYFLQLPA